jgi:transcriptional regulator with XRE-family HTH domain
MGDFSGESLALAIKEAGLTKSEVARRMGVTPQTMNDYIKRNPTIDTWNKFYIAIGKEPLKQYSAFDELQTTPEVNEEDAPTYGQSATDYNLVGQLKELSELYRSGLLNDEEFAEAKQIVIKKFKSK